MFGFLVKKVYQTTTIDEEGQKDFSLFQATRPVSS
jgi:hypothetical protein